MKKLLLLCVALVLVFSACGQTSQEPATTPTIDEMTTTEALLTEAPTTPSLPSTLPKVQFTATKHQLLPPEQAFDAEFEAFYGEFKAAVQGKDMRFIDSMLSEGVMSSFGGEIGKDFFHEYWSEGWSRVDLWTVLEEIIALGGTYYQAGEYSSGFGKCFAAPYTFKGLDELGLDAFEHYIVIDKNVPVYGANSKAIGTLDYCVLEYHYSDGFLDIGPEDFVGVKLLSGETGYVQRKYVRSPIDYRLCIEQKDGEWKLNWLIAGD